MQIDHHHLPCTNRKNCDVPFQSDHPRAPDPFLFAFYKDHLAISAPFDESEILIDSLQHAILACEPTPFRVGTHLQPLAGSNNKTDLFVPKEKMTTNGANTTSSTCMEKKLLLPQEFSQDDEEDSISSSSFASETQELKISKCCLTLEKRWEEHFQTLLQYKEKHGNCHVPQNYPEDLALASWVRRQRHQYKLKQQNKKSSMSDKRQLLLEEAGFTWDPQTDCWEIRRQELEEYLMEHGHCNVPSRYSKNPQLATWVKRQRRQYKHFLEEGRASRFHKERFAILCKMGFVWKARGTKATRKA